MERCPVLIDHIHCSPAIIGFHAHAIVEQRASIATEQEHLHLAACANHMDMRRIVVIDIDDKAQPGFSMDHNYTER